MKGYGWLSGLTAIGSAPGSEFLQSIATLDACLPRSACHKVSPVLLAQLMNFLGDNQ